MGGVGWSGMKGREGEEEGREGVKLAACCVLSS